MKKSLKNLLWNCKWMEHAYHPATLQHLLSCSATEQVRLDFTVSKMSRQGSEEIQREVVPSVTRRIRIIRNNNPPILKSLDTQEVVPSVTRRIRIVRNNVLKSNVEIENSHPSFPNWNQELSSKLWLPIDSACIKSNLNSSRSSFERTIRNSWFAVRKMETNPIINSNDSISVTSLLSKETNKTELENVIRIKKYRLFLTKEVSQKLKQWFHITRWIYNKCVEWLQINSGIKPTLKLLRDYIINSKTITHDPNIIKILSLVHYDVKDGSIRDFMKAYTTQCKLVKEGKKIKFEMKYRERKNIGRYLASLTIPHKHFKMETKDKNTIISCFPTFLSKNPFIIREKIGPISHDTRLTWNGGDVFELHVPTDTKVIKKKHRGVVAIDPGEKIFASLYGISDESSQKGESYLIGENSSKKVDKLATIAARMRNGIKRTIKEGIKEYEKTKSSRTLKHLKRKANCLEQRAKNMISDVHRKTVKFLTSKYETIIIPQFQTQQMAKKRKEDGTWKRNIGKNVTRRMIRWSHYRFRELLRNKGVANGNKVFVGTEEWTSKTCGNCFNVNQNLGGSRHFNCPSCGHCMHRDINAARNILILNWNKIFHS